MRHYCAEASIYGDKTQPAHQPFPKVIVILNPVADKKSAADTVCFQIFPQQSHFTRCIFSHILILSKTIFYAV